MISHKGKEFVKRVCLAISATENRRIRRTVSGGNGEVAKMNGVIGRRTMGMIPGITADLPYSYDTIRCSREIHRRAAKTKVKGYKRLPYVLLVHMVYVYISCELALLNVHVYASAGATCARVAPPATTLTAFDCF